MLEMLWKKNMGNIFLNNKTICHTNKSVICWHVSMFLLVEFNINVLNPQICLLLVRSCQEPLKDPIDNILEHLITSQHNRAMVLYGSGKTLYCFI